MEKPSSGVLVKRCPRCNFWKHHSLFYVTKNRASLGLSNYCKPCTRERRKKYKRGRLAQTRIDNVQHVRAWRKRHPEKAKELARQTRYRKQYRMSIEGIEAMKVAQGGRCLLCQRSAILVVDHDHETGRVRGMLCLRCNSWLGTIENNPGIMDRARGYLDGGALP